MPALFTNVQAAEVLDGGGNSGFPVVQRRHIMMGERCSAPGLSDASGHGATGLVVEVGHEDCGTLTGKPFRGGLADAAPGACHQRHPSVESLHCHRPSIAGRLFRPSSPPPHWGTRGQGPESLGRPSSDKSHLPSALVRLTDDPLRKQAGWRSWSSWGVRKTRPE